MKQRNDSCYIQEAIAVLRGGEMELGGGGGGGFRLCCVSPGARLCTTAALASGVAPPLTHLPCTHSCVWKSSQPFNRMTFPSPNKKKTKPDLSHPSALFKHARPIACCRATPTGQMAV